MVSTTVEVAFLAFAFAAVALLAKRGALTDARERTFSARNTFDFNQNQSKDPSNLTDSRAHNTTGTPTRTSN